MTIFSSNISAHMRDNPLPLLLISTGVGLMITRAFRDTGYQGGYGMYRDTAHGDLTRRSADPTAGYGNNRDEYSASSSSHMSLREEASALYESASEGLSEMSEQASDYTRRARSGLSALASDQPLVLGALGLLAGAAVAAMLPRTQMEEDYVGSAARQVRDQASDMASETFERAKHAAARAVDVAEEDFASSAPAEKAGASGGPSQSAASQEAARAPGAGAMGVQSGAGGARPSETIAAGQGARKP